jgi:DHA1 family bicyclomycin/chloramphenicol resistance-like MFS transporter
MPLVLRDGIKLNGAVKLTTLLGFLCAFAPFSIDLYLAAFPTMARDMGTHVERIQLTLSVFLFGLAIGQLIYGPLSDRFGRRRPLMAGLLIYTAASLLMIFTRDITLFLALRFIQALGGCAGMIIARAIVRDSYDVEGSAKVFTLIMAIQSIGPVVAPVVGAYIVSNMNWGVCFVFMTFLGAGCFLATLFTLSETLPEEKRVRQSPLEVLKLFGALLSKKDFLLMVLSGSVGGASIFAFISGSPHVLIDIYGFSEARYGWTFGLFSLAVASVSQINFLLLRKYKAIVIFTLGVSSMTFFGVFMTLIVEIRGFPSAFWLIILLFLALMSLPLIAANSSAIAMSLGGRQAGSASSVLGVSHFASAGVVSFLMGPAEMLVSFPISFMIALCALSSLILLMFFKAGPKPLGKG